MKDNALVKDFRREI